MKLNRIVSGLLAVTMAASTTAMLASAQTPAAEMSSSKSASVVTIGKVRSGSKYSYSVNDDGKTVTLVAFTKKAISGGTLKIPTKLDKKKVTAISDYIDDDIYINGKKIKNIEIPKTVKEIDNSVARAILECCPKVTIKCDRGSYAETFAAKMGIKYKLKKASKNYLYAPIISKGAAVGQTAVKFKWGKVSKAVGYQVYKWDSSKNKFVKIADTKSTFYRDTKLEEDGNTNYYKVRAYRKVGGKTYYSKFSQIKGLYPYITSAPKILRVTTECNEFENCINITVKNQKYSSFADVQIYDPRIKKWCDLGSMLVNEYDEDEYWGGTETTSSFSHYYITKGGKSYQECIDKNQTYKLRLKNCGSIDDTVIEEKYTYEDHSYSYFDIINYHRVYGKTATTTVKVK